MDRTLFLDFNKAYGTEATAEEKQLVNDLLNLWGKLEPTAGRNPAFYRRGILFGMALQKGIDSGEIKLRKVRASRKANKPQDKTQESAGETTAEL